MIEHLLIKQFAIIDTMEIDFQPPFTVLTGETGAGKSILIDAVSLLLGERSSSEMIRHGASKAYIEGVFRFSDSHPVYLALAQGGWAEENDAEFVLSRELNENGRNPCRINGYTVSFNVYRQFANTLIDIHGQHEYQQLMQSNKQLDILDAYGGVALAKLKQEVREAWESWEALEHKLVNARENLQAFTVKKDFLLFQLNEIDEAHISSGEETALETEITRLSHSQRIVKGLDQVHRYLFQYTDGESAYDLLAKALQQLKNLGRYDPELDGVYERLEPASYLMDEASREISHYQDQFDVSPARLEEAEARLYKIRTLGKKYGEGTQAILAHRQSIADELREMEEFTEKEDAWEEEAKAAKEQYETLCVSLSDARREVKDKLEVMIDKEFLDLAMQAAHFRADLRESAPGPSGADSVEFLIAANRGEPFLPLAKIASGGELSRITLAMKRILATSDTCETLIFDEVDSGVGGATIQTVAEKLLSISRSQQVICVTHSPVIAAKANQHLLLEKAEQDGRTTTSVQDLDNTQRVAELSRMLGGDESSEDLQRFAKSMLAPHDI